MTYKYTHEWQQHSHTCPFFNYDSHPCAGTLPAFFYLNNYLYTCKTYSYSDTLLPGRTHIVENGTQITFPVRKDNRVYLVTGNISI